METKKKRGGAHLAPPAKQTKGQGRPTHAGGARSASKGKKKPLSRRDIRRRAVIVVLAVLAAILCSAAAVLAFFQRPEIPDPQKIPEKIQQGEMEFDNGAMPKISGPRKEGFYTFLVIGRDTGGGGNADTILLAAYDTVNQKLNVMSIPRDTMVNVSWDVKKINSVYNQYGGGDKGMKALYNEISQLVGFVPDYSVVVEWEAVGKLVDAIGGVWYDVPRQMDYDDPAQNLHIHVNKGYQKLDGKDAMGVVRFREGRNGYATGDLGRIETQQGFLKALIEQCLQIDKMPKVLEYARIFNEEVTTDLSVNHLAWFAQKAIFGGLKTENVTFVTMPNDTKNVWSRSYHARLSYVVPQVEELIETVNDYFNPYLDDLTSSDLDIMYVNANGTIGCTSGKLQDTRANGSIGSGGSGGSSSTTKPKTDSGTTQKPATQKPTTQKPTTSKPQEPNEDEPNTGTEPAPEKPGTEEPGGTTPSDPTPSDPTPGGTTETPDPTPGGTETPDPAPPDPAPSEPTDVQTQAPEDTIFITPQTPAA